MQTKQPEGVRLFTTKPYRAYDGSIGQAWNQVERPSRGSVMERTGIFQRRDGTYEAFYRAVNPHPFAQVIPVSESEKADWSNEASNIASQFHNKPTAMLEKVERISVDHLICRIWRRDHNSPPDLCIGETGWSLLPSSYNSLTRDKLNGKRAYLTFDGIGWWEVLSILPPIDYDEPVRVEIVRKSSLPLPGHEGVLEGRHLDFVADEEKRRQIEEAIREIERDLVSDRSSRIIIPCSRAADSLILEIGRQHLGAGRTFGGGKVQFDKPHKWLDASLNARTGAFFTEFEDSEFNSDLVRFRAPLDSLRQWSNVARHAGSNEKLLIEPDGFTAATCYAALRDFVRVLLAIHTRNTKLLRPEPMPTSQAAKP